MSFFLAIDKHSRHGQRMFWLFQVARSSPDAPNFPRVKDDAQREKFASFSKKKQNLCSLPDFRKYINHIQLKHLISWKDSDRRKPSSEIGLELYRRTFCALSTCRLPFSAVVEIHIFSRTIQSTKYSSNLRLAWFYFAKIFSL